MFADPCPGVILQILARLGMLKEFLNFLYQ